MYNENGGTQTHALCDADPETCLRPRDSTFSSKSVIKMIGLLFLFAYAGCLAVFSRADVMPTQTPIDTTLGGTGAAEHSLSQLAPIPDNVEIVQNLRGPNFGIGRERQSIHMVAMTEKNLPGVSDYYLRSSYVVLQPGGFAPIHSHAGRPAFLQVVSGGIAQHRSDGLSLLMGQGDFTFSGDELAHWWINESSDTAIRLWIVELCNAGHGCKEAIKGGAQVLGRSKMSVRSQGKGVEPDVATLMSIDLAGEFKDAPKMGARELRLRRIEIAPGAAVAKSDLGGSRPTFFRVGSGSLTMTDAKGTHAFPTHSIVLSASAPNGSHWKNPGREAAVVYVVDLLNP